MCAAAQWRLEEELSRAIRLPCFMGQRPIPAGFCLVTAAMNEGPLCWEQGEASEPDALMEKEMAAPRRGEEALDRSMVREVGDGPGGWVDGWGSLRGLKGRWRR
jgi:hypothetical protein